MEKILILGFQHLFAMFGATLVPPSHRAQLRVESVIFTFLPVFSSFAFIGVIVIVATRSAVLIRRWRVSCIADLPSSAAVCGHRHHGGGHCTRFCAW